MTREQLVAELEQNVPLIENRNVWIWGAGNAALHFQETLKRSGIDICGYCDSAQEKWGKFGRWPVISPDHLLMKKNVCVLICIGREEQAAEVVEWLKISGIQWYLFEEAVLKLHKEEILKCYDLLTDETSKNVYANIIRYRMQWFAEIQEVSCIFDNQYFCLPEFNRIEGMEREVFVDCGAYVGDTIEKYIWKQGGLFQKIIAFEPDEGNFHAMAYRMERLRKEWNLREDSIELHRSGVGMKSGKCSFIQSETGTSGKMDFSSLESRGEGNTSGVDIVSLDEFLSEPYSLLKADIEGAEYDMLKGAENGICANKPLLAICIYHHTTDLFQIQLLLHHMVPEYKFAVRHHSAMKTETVLYAYIK